MKIIAISGKQCSGKSTIANGLQERLNKTNVKENQISFVI